MCSPVTPLLLCMPIFVRMAPLALHARPGTASLTSEFLFNPSHREAWTQARSQGPPRLSVAAS